MKSHESKRRYITMVYMTSKFNWCKWI